jgi:aminoglycoside 6-adenylyltransferase
MDIDAAYQDMETRIVFWAQARPDVHAVLVVGSRARCDHIADIFSDLDLILFSENPTLLAGERDWLAQFGEVWAACLDHTGAGDPEWLVLYAGGLKADFVLSQMPGGLGGSASLVKALEQVAYDEVLARGVRVLVDKTDSAPLQDSPASGLQPLAGLQSASLPDQNAFRACIERFLVQAARAAKLVRRGDLWRAKGAVDGELKATLLTMLEWHARAVHGLEHDTWYGGRFIREWADPRALAEMPGTFAAFDQADMQRALFATLELFRWLANETAARLGYTYPLEPVKQMAAWMQSIADFSS